MSSHSTSGPNRAAPASGPPVSDRRYGEGRSPLRPPCGCPSWMKDVGVAPLDPSPEDQPWQPRPIACLCTGQTHHGPTHRRAYPVRLRDPDLYRRVIRQQQQPSDGVQAHWQIPVAKGSEISLPVGNGAPPCTSRHPPGLAGEVESDVDAQAPVLGQWIDQPLEWRGPLQISHW